jgi:hypothetical protein
MKPTIYHSHIEATAKCKKPSAGLGLCQINPSLEPALAEVLLVAAVAARFSSAQD